MAVPPTSPDTVAPGTVAPDTQAPDKAVLRRAMRRARADFCASLDDTARADLEAALAARVALLLSGRANIAGYAALPGEIDPCGVPFGIWPRVVGPGDPLAFHLAHRGELAPGCWGILEPPGDAPGVVPDAMVIPLLAADTNGTRLGYGAGHYDRSLALPALATALRIGVAWDMQVVDALLADPWDVPLDWLVTPTRSIDCRAPSRTIDCRAPSRTIDCSAPSRTIDCSATAAAVGAPPPSR